MATMCCDQPNKQSSVQGHNNISNNKAYCEVKVVVKLSSRPLLEGMIDMFLTFCKTQKLNFTHYQMKVPYIMLMKFRCICECK